MKPNKREKLLLKTVVVSQKENERKIWVIENRFLLLNRTFDSTVITKSVIIIVIIIMIEYRLIIRIIKKKVSSKPKR